VPAHPVLEILQARWYAAYRGGQEVWATSARGLEQSRRLLARAEAHLGDAPALLAEGYSLLNARREPREP
jgi:hypothetical protein